MKTKIKNIKYLVTGIIIGLSLISIATYAYTTQAGKIGSLFVKIGSSYKLKGDEIQDNTVDNSEIENDGTYKVGKLGIGINPTFKLDVNGSIQASSWVRVKGNNGLYFQDHGGGWNMTDNTWIRSYGNKNVYINKMLRADDGFQVDGRQMISSNGYVHTARATANNHYGYFEVRRNDGKRGAYFGRGNGGDTVYIVSDYASKFWMNQNLHVSGSVKTTCIGNCF